MTTLNQCCTESVQIYTDKEELLLLKMIWKRWASESYTKSRPEELVCVGGGRGGGGEGRGKSSP